MHIPTYPHTTRPHDTYPRNEQALITRIVTLENEIEEVEGARARRLFPDTRLNGTLRRLRRERASALAVLLE